MHRVLALGYGATAYILFLGTFLYALGFIGNFGVPKTLDGPAAVPWPTALLTDLGLLTLFAVQHSVMARPAFKRVLTRVIPEAIERSTYVLASSAALLLLFWQWQPLGGVVWRLESTAGQALMYTGFAAGWLLVLVTTFVINHFDLFGLRQVWAHWRGETATPAAFVTPLLYRMVRHPLYVGWLLAFWCTPTMTLTHLLFAGMTTAYILVAIQWEERDLMRAHPEYAAYRTQVPMLMPRWPRRTPAGSRAAAATAVMLTLGAWAAQLSAETVNVPANLQVPDGHVAYLKASATGTQNYVCLPASGSSGPAWKFQGPQATLFVTVKWFPGVGEVRQQVATHYLSPNPAEGGTLRATWQGSVDTSAVWAKKVAESTDPAYVRPGAIPWLLLEVVGRQRGPAGGAMVTGTTYLQRVNTSGGSAPAAGTACTEAGALAMVPYTTDYIFYRAR